VNISGILGGQGSGIKVCGQLDGDWTGGSSAEGRIIHRPVWVHLWPQMIILPWYTIAQPILEKVMVHALHIVMTDRSKCKARPGIIWAVHAPGGNKGMSSMHVWVECTRLPLGRWAMMGMAVGRMFVAGAEVVRK
jgi:hypothetical protein